MPRVSLRAYSTLNDFLAEPIRQRSSEHAIERRTSVKDFLERVGIPHVEVDLLLVNGASCGFERLLEAGDRVAAFPRFFHVDIAGASRVRSRENGPVRFVLDVHLGRLARYLRLAGLDARYAREATDDQLASVAASQRRVLLTRDVGLLKRRIVEYGYFIRSTNPDVQFVEVLQRFGPLPISPFSRCLQCGDELRPVDKADVLDELPPRTRDHYDEFRRCVGCGRLFWKGAHYARLAAALEHGLTDAGGC